MKFTELGQKPISEAQPAGEDARYTPEFEELQAEIDRLSIPSQAGQVDWEKIVRLAAQILEEKSKDLLAASYLAVALIHTKKEEGLATGVRVLADLTRNFWDIMFPPIKRKKGRIRIIEWWQEKTLAALEKYKPFRFKESLFRELKEILDEWDRFLEEKLPEHPSIFSLIRFLEETAEIEPEAKPEEKKPPLEESAKPTTIKEISASPEEISTPEEARRELNRLIQGLRKVSQFFRENAPEDPLGYRLLRTAVWLNLREPAAGNDGVTKIPPPPAQVRTSLVNLEQAGNWEQLLAMSEGRLGQFPLWLDLNRLSYAALMGLGRNEAAEAVAQETKALIKRYPGLLRLFFSDGMPFAGEETKKWLAEEAPEEKPVSQEETPKERGDEEELEAFLSRLRVVACKEGLGQAVTLLQERLQSGNGERIRFLGRLGLAELFIEAKKLPLALLLLEEILNDLEKFQLERWDPPLALRALRTVWHGFRLSQNREHKQKVHEILARIAQLDATAILNLLEEKV